MLVIQKRPSWEFIIMLGNADKALMGFDFMLVIQKRPSWDFIIMGFHYHVSNTEKALMGFHYHAERALMGINYHVGNAENVLMGFHYHVSNIENALCRKGSHGISLSCW